MHDYPHDFPPTPEAIERDAETQERVGAAIAALHAVGPCTDIPFWDEDMALFRHIDEHTGDEWIVELYDLNEGAGLQGIAFNRTVHCNEPFMDLHHTDYDTVPFIDDPFTQSCIDDDYIAYLNGEHKPC